MSEGVIRVPQGVDPRRPEDTASYEREVWLREARERRAQRELERATAVAMDRVFAVLPGGKSG